MTIPSKAVLPLGCLTAWLVFTAGCGSSRRTAAIGETIPMGGSELTITRSEASSAGGRMQVSVFFRWTGSAADLIPGFRGAKMKMTLVDGAGEKYKPARPKWSPIQPLPEEMYSLMRNFDSYSNSRGADGRFEEDAMRDVERFKKLEADINAGRNPVAWVQVFELPWNRGDLVLVVVNPRRRLGQPGTVEVPLSR
ncbi:MAG: hypothetical protein LLG20_22100 [Acidobacteriales bacterium]|nr:hypothetical protein [Terriglobales bacterium]